MRISVSQIYRVREGKRSINQKFIIGAIKAFPGHKFDDLFYLTEEQPVKENQGRRIPSQALKSSPSAIDLQGQCPLSTLEG